MQKCLIANRGEIACRLIQAAQQYGLLTVAIYSDADRHSLHVQLADEAYRVGASEASQSYLQQQVVIDIAQKSGCDAIHPGYGLLSENAVFAMACSQAGLTFIGPSSDVIELMGDKKAAKEVAKSLDIPIVEGMYVPKDFDVAWCKRTVLQQGDWLVKARQGGGGRGMRIVRHGDDLYTALQSAKKEAKSFFDDDGLLLERVIDPARHIEVQILADKHGNVIHLFDRDCSLQRRHQKVIEQAPATGISLSIREKMFAAALKLAKHVNYESAGTVEFLVDEAGNYYFLEMNTRLQVEHPVTEMVTDQDIVQWQFIIADGKTLDLAQSDVHCEGVALEARLCAEQPRHDFLPSVGLLEVCQFPLNSEVVRVDTGFTAGDTISPYYDSLLAKVIVQGADRAAAVKQLFDSLQQTFIFPLRTNRNWLTCILMEKQFSTQPITTDYLKQMGDELDCLQTQTDTLLIAGLLYEQMWQQAQVDHNEQWYAVTPAPLCLRARLVHRWDDDGNEFVIQMKARELNQFDICINDVQYDHVILHDADIGMITFEVNQNVMRANCVVFDDVVMVHMGTSALVYYLRNKNIAISVGDSKQKVIAPLPGSVLKVHIKPGDRVTTGQILMIVEAMKMEHRIHAPCDAIVKHIAVDINQQVMQNDCLVEFE